MKKVLSVLIVILLLAVSVFCFVSCAPKDEYEAGFVSGTEFAYAKDAPDGHATVYIPSGREARVLLLTDPQLDPTQKYGMVGSTNDLTITFLNKFLDAVQPDFVLIAGDMIMTVLDNNWTYFCSIADIFEKRHLPWSFVFGNHDCENKYVSQLAFQGGLFGQISKEKFIEAVQENYKYCLINSEDCADGYGNHIINIRDKDGRLLQTFCNLDCVYMDDTYNHNITEEQSRWYKQTIQSIAKNENKENISSIVVTHVPLPESSLAWDEAFTDGKPNEHYYYGQILESNYKKYQKENSFFDTLLEVGSTKAVFYGHAHSNDASVEYKGIRLTYIQHSGMSHEYRTTHTKDYVLCFWPIGTVFDLTDVDTYGDQRGGTLVTIQQDASYTFTPVYAKEVIPDYNDWAVDYDQVAQNITKKRGAGSVIRGK